jgi:hypothetical protein
MKYLRCLLIIVAMTTLSGCMTSIVTYNRARGKYTWPTEPEEKMPKLKPKPVYYGLLPLTIPFDVATSPVQMPLFIMWITMPAPESSPFDEE